MAKKLSAATKADMKMHLAVWAHGRKKATITVAIQKLIQTGLGEHPDIKKAISILEEEREKLQNKVLF